MAKLVFIPPTHSSKMALRLVSQLHRNRQRLRVACDGDEQLYEIQDKRARRLAESSPTLTLDQAYYRVTHELFRGNFE